MKSDKYKNIFDSLLKNKYILILIAAGLVLMVFSTGKKKSDTIVSDEKITEAQFSVEKLEARISDVLSEIQGAGKVKVMLTVKSGTEQVLAENRESSEKVTGDGSESEDSVQMVIVENDSGESPVTVKYIYPEFQGALVVAQGADDVSVRLALIEAVSDLTGLGTDKISVTKMNCQTAE